MELKSLLMTYSYGEHGQLPNMTANQVIAICKPQFSQHGKPDVLITDNRPQFSSNTYISILYPTISVQSSDLQPKKTPFN